MPQALFVISWDQLEGAIITDQYPRDVEININNVQTIDVAHSFNKGSPWIVVEDKGFKAVSYYNETLMRAIALVLHPNEVPAHFVKFLEQLAEFVLPVNDEEAISRRLQEAFSLVQAEIPVTEVVLLNFANEIQQLKEKVLDQNLQIKCIMERTAEIETKVLLYLLASDGAIMEQQIVADLAGKGCTPEQVKNSLHVLLGEKLVEFHAKDHKYALTLIVKPSS
ncbi:MAG: hypothetical protein GYA24_08710 [Candidatus Lokiarchaeota archaeon]|nr:hypothetical protein [Candidatus Lokiarchaeota archaeon]